MLRLPIFSVSGNINCTTDSECLDGMVCYNKLCTGRKFYRQLSVYISKLILILLAPKQYRMIILETKY